MGLTVSKDEALRADCVGTEQGKDGREGGKSRGRSGGG